MFLTIHMHQVGWLSEKGGNFLNLLQKEGVPRKGGFPQKRGCSNPGGKCDLAHNSLLLKLVKNSTYIKENLNINNNRGDSIAEGTVSEPTCHFQYWHGKIKENL